MDGIKSTSTSKAEINVTPLIDILLVLLIVFMIIAPTISRGLPTAVPQPTLNSQSITEQSNIILQISNDRTYRLNGVELSESSLGREIHEVFANRAEKALFLQADGNLEYRDIARAIDRIRGTEPSIQIGFLPVGQ